MWRFASISQSARTEAMLDAILEVISGVALAVLTIGLVGFLFDYFDKK
jgi:succinate dehydrogenase hydrophobic anchor subunit